LHKDEAAMSNNEPKRRDEEEGIGCRERFTV
jgi:hypothetical protein